MVYLQDPYAGITLLCQVALGEGPKQSSLPLVCGYIWYKKTSSFDPPPHRLQLLPKHSHISI